MRKRELVNELKEILKDFNYSSSLRGNHYIVSNHSILIKKIHKLEQMGLFLEDIAILKAEPDVYFNFTEKISLTESDHTSYMSLIHTLNTKIGGVIEASNVFLTKENENTISVKLPDIKNLVELSSFADDLNKCFSGILFDDKLREEFKLTGFDSGSMWLEIGLESSFAVSAIGSAAWAALVIKKKYYEVEKIKKDIEMTDMNMQMLESVTESLDNSIKKLIECEANNLLSEFEINDTPENIGRISLSIKLLFELFVKGCELHGKLNQPIDVENPFPNYNSTELISSRIKQIASEETV